MRTRPTVRALALALSIGTDALAAPDGPGPEQDPGAEAIEVGRAALDTYARAEWETAYAQFAAAERLVHSPVFVLYMARCKRNSGRLLEARELFRALAREHLPPDAPAPWAQAAAAGHAELGTLQQNIPSLWLRNPPQSKLRFALIAGRSLELSEGGSELELDPGEHVIELVAVDGRRSRVSIELREGQRRVPLLLPVASVDAGKLGPATAPRPPIPTGRVVGYSALGLGALGVVTGVVSGLVAKQRTDELKRESCDETGHCYADSRPQADATSRWATLSTLSFVVGGGALVAGAGILLFTADAGGSQASVVMRGVF